MHRLIPALLFFALPAAASAASAPVDPALIRDVTGSDLAKEFAAEFARRDMLAPVQHALPNYQFTNHDNFWQVNAQNADLFKSQNIDQVLYNEIFDALNEWFAGPGAGQDPDFIVFYKAWDPASYGAFYAPISNDIKGIGYQHQGTETFDQSPNLKLQGLIWMSALNQYSHGAASRVVLDSFWGQEVGHRWGSFVFYDKDGNPDTRDDHSDAILGRDKAHWSYYMDTDWSVMEGNDWTENEDGTFTSNFDSFNNSYGYCPLDLYTMGLIPASAVPDMFLIENPSGAGNPASPPEMPFGSGSPVTLSGDKLNISMEQITAVEGIRLPQWNEAPRRLKVAMFVLSRFESPMSDAQVDQADTYSTWMEQDFARNTRNLAKLDMGTKAAPANQAPTAVIEGETEVKSGTGLALDASSSTDPENHKLAYVWDFGDGTGDFESGALVEHVFNSRGTFTVTMTAVDEEGALGQTQLEVTVTKAKTDDGGLFGCSCTVAPSNQGAPLAATFLLLGLAGLGTIVIRRRQR